MSSHGKFLDLCLAGKVFPEEIDDFVDRWHEDPDSTELHDYLGMTKEEYSLWLRVPDALLYIIKARHEMTPLTDVVASACQDCQYTGQSDDQSQISRLRTWLKANKELL